MKKATGNQKFSCEYVIKTSPVILWEMISSPSGLAEWFANDVDQRGKEFIFTWDRESQTARLVGLEEEQYIRFQWLDSPAGEFFEFRIDVTDITNDTVLIITDFAKPGELEDARMLWDQQIHQLKKRLGVL
ncbi:MAG: START-like domain-containing protein [Chitinophagales bacterium]|nr:SRPBCC domain-containing protein [Chitinophagales bacterium]MDW8392726.1 START-like domain-containing protein [Chitinophagales bacterium]